MQVQYLRNTFLITIFFPDLHTSNVYAAKDS